MHYYRYNYIESFNHSLVISESLRGGYMERIIQEIIIIIIFIIIIILKIITLLLQIYLILKIIQIG